MHVVVSVHILFEKCIKIIIEVLKLSEVVSTKFVIASVEFMIYR